MIKFMFVHVFKYLVCPRKSEIMIQIHINLANKIHVVNKQVLLTRAYQECPTFSRLCMHLNRFELVKDDVYY